MTTTPEPPTSTEPEAPEAPEARTHSVGDRALKLWIGDVPEGDEAMEAFKDVYSDPVSINGVSTPVSLLVDRARDLQNALEEMRHDIVHRIDAPGRLAFAFTMSGRHVGPLATPLGQLPPTGATLTLNGMDLFIIDTETDRVTAVWASADYLGLLQQVGAVSLVAMTSVQRE